MSYWPTLCSNINIWPFSALNPYADNVWDYGLLKLLDALLPLQQ